MTDDGGVSFENAVCASCGGRVGDARCATCRAALEQLREAAVLPAGPVLLAALLLLVTLVLLQLT
ncbi:MAG: hypothetical protein Q8R60_20030 [Mycobacteriales bacterium]|nr:hypothetical protein [Mycobacteriales bacterium]